ncbi:MAG TPA: Rieske 2Fe-2S domain-containing protein [Gemmatimonadaceae bacterium]|nr:Rieske 2Fe-2S domain-containing protein [Gemmatimonadaceae bacterium]
MEDSGFEAVAKVDEVPDEGTFGVVKSTGEPVCLIRHGGRITAVSDTCAHQEFAMSLGDVLPDGTIQCAWHGARFDTATGAVRQGPATDPLPIFTVKIEDGMVLVGPACPRAGAGHRMSEAWIPAGEVEQ